MDELIGEMQNFRKDLETIKKDQNENLSTLIYNISNLKKLTRWD